jgi:hypothetical protein
MSASRQERHDNHDYHNHDYHNHDYHNHDYHPAGADLRDAVRPLAAALKVSNAPAMDES